MIKYTRARAQHKYTCKFSTRGGGAAASRKLMQRRNSETVGNYTRTRAYEGCRYLKGLSIVVTSVSECGKAGKRNLQPFVSANIKAINPFWTHQREARARIAKEEGALNYFFCGYFRVKTTPKTFIRRYYTCGAHTICSK